MKKFLVAAVLSALSLPAVALANPRGMTWGTYGHYSENGVDFLSCYGGEKDCDPYRGDTMCSRRLPLLCINVDGSTVPASYAYPDTWAAGNVATTIPIRGQDLTSVDDGNLVCSAAFGAGWRMAEFHDAWGWGFSAFGHVRDDMRFWVYIDDQPANCWD